MNDLLDLIFACGLSVKLTQALVDLFHYLLPLPPTIQESLLNMISVVLCGRPFKPLSSPTPPQAHSAFDGKQYRDGQAPEEKDAEITLALHTLGSFDFAGRPSPIPPAPLVIGGEPGTLANIPDHSLNEFVILR